jgi:transposase
VAAAQSVRLAGFDLRLKFIARLIEGEAMTDVCLEFGIAWKTGYRIFNRYKEEGLQAPSDRSRRPVRYANQLPPQIESRIVRLEREKPHWGAHKIRELLMRRRLHRREARDDRRLQRLGSGGALQEAILR